MRNRNVIREILRFIIVGAVATIIHYAVYYLLQQHIEVNVSYTIGYIVSFVFNYVLSARFTFRRQTTVCNGLGFCMAHVVNYIMQVCLLNLFLFLGVSKPFAPIPVYCIAVPVNFLLVRFVFMRFK